MHYVKLFILMVIIVGGSLTLTNCGSSEPNTEQFELSLLTNQSEYYTLQAIAIRSGESLKKDVYNANFGEKNIDVFKTASNMLAFVIPEVTTGNYTLSIEDFSQTFQFKVKETVLTKSPEQLVDDISFYGFHTIEQALRKSDSLINIGAMSSDDLLIKELRTAKDSANAALARFNNLDDTKKREAALFLEANLQAFYQFDNIIHGVYEDGSFKRGPCGYNETFQKTTCLIKQMMAGITIMAAPLAIGGMVGGGIGALVSGGIAAQPLALAGAIVGGVIFYKLLILPGMTRFKNAWSELANMSFVPADDLMAEISLNKKSVTFFNGEPKEIEFSFNARNLQAKDAQNSEFSEVGLLISTYNEIADQMGYSSIGYSANRISRTRIEDMSSAQVSIISGNAQAYIQSEGTKAYMVVSTESDQTETFKFTISVNYGNATLTSNAIDAQVDGGAILGDVSVKFGSNTFTLNYLAEENPYDMDNYFVKFTGKLVMEGNTPSFDKLQLFALADRGWSGDKQTAAFPIQYNINDSTFEINIRMSPLDNFENGLVKTIKITHRDSRYIDPNFELNANYYLNYSELSVICTEN